jgi:transposase-like protein
LEKHLMSRPIKYKDDMPARAEKLAAAGQTMESIARAFGVHGDTLDNWVHQETELREAIERGRIRFHSECVEKSLFERIGGYFYEEKTEELRKVKERDPITGKTVTVERPVAVKTVRKHVPPDTRAIIFAAKCLMPDKYKDRQEVQISGLTEFTAELQKARKRASCIQSS